MEDALDLGSSGETREGSNPSPRNINSNNISDFQCNSSPK